MEKRGENVLSKISNFIEYRIRKNNLSDISSDKDEFLINDLEDSLSFQSFQNKFALEHGQTISFAIGFFSSASLAHLIKKSFQIKRFRMHLFAGYGLPIFFGSFGAVLNKFNIDGLFKLEHNCKECFELRTIGTVSLFPNLNSFLFSSIITWVGKNEADNIKIFRFARNESYKQFGKKLFFDYLDKLSRGDVYRKILLILILSSSLAYLFAVEQEREFKIVFNKYYEGLKFEQETHKQGIYLDKDAKI